MIRHEDMERLLSFVGNGQHVLSLYLDMTPARNERHAYLVTLKDLFRSVEEGLTHGEQKRAWREESTHLQRFLETGYTQQGRGLVLFSSLPQHLWQVFHLTIPVPNLVRFEPRPYVQPFLNLWQDYERYAVVLVDKEKARLFTVFMGEIEEHVEIWDEVPGKHKQGGWSSADFQRHHQAHVVWHLKGVAEALAAFWERRPFEWLVLAGPTEALSEFQRHLPTNLGARVAGTFNVALYASAAEILQQTLILEQQISRKAEETLVEELLGASRTGGPAVLGLADTLAAVQEGRVYKVALVEGFASPVWRCRACGHLLAQALSACPLCQGTLEEAPDSPSRLREVATSTESRVVVVKGEAAHRLLEAGGIGAILRF